MTVPGPILVTGAAGFVGGRLARTLADHDCETHAVLSPSSNPWRLDGASRLIRHTVDLRDAAAVRRLVEAVRPSVIYNLASHGAYPFQSDPLRIVETNVLGLTNLLVACESVDYRLFVHTGSSSEYGRKRAPMQESDELMPESVYGVSKVAQSLLCRQWSLEHQRPIVVFRLFSVYGPLEEPTRLIPRLLSAHLDDVPIALAAPNTSRDFIFVDDVVEALLKVDQLRGVAGSILNLGTGRQTTLQGIVQILESVTGRAVKARWGTMPPRPWDTDTWVADVARLRRDLQWAPAVSVADGLARSLHWLQANRRYYPAVVDR
jgi:nucleoside-diphosphate-sugar epimerase